MALSAAKKKAALKTAKEAGMVNPTFITVDEAYLAANPGIKNPEGEEVQVGDEIIVDKPEDKDASEITKVVFTRKDGSKREFNAELHGEDFVSVADEFEGTNKAFIAKRENL